MEPYINLTRLNKGIILHYSLPEKRMGPSSGGKDLDEAETRILEAIKNYPAKNIYLKSTLRKWGIPEKELKNMGYSILKKIEFKKLTNSLNKKQKDITFKLAA